MSKTAADNDKRMLVPKLRFPEFRNTDSWKATPFDQVYEFKPTNSLSRDALNYQKGRVKNIHYGDIHTKFSTLFDVTKEVVPFVNDDKHNEAVKSASYCKEGDIVFADASEDMDDIGKSIEIINLGHERVVSGQHTLLAHQKQKLLANGFGGYLFKSAYVRAEIKREAQGAKVLGISPRRLGKIELVFPSDPSEQQKIADCLSSLDALIAAHTDKLAALKHHKQGLLQQLFPRDGETAPRLRFPEFRNAGEWRMRPFGGFAKFASGGTPSKDNPTYWNGGIPWVSASAMHDTIIAESDATITRTAVSDGAPIAKKGTLLILVRGSMLFKRVPICISAVDVSFNQDIKAVTLRGGMVTEFVLYELVAKESVIPINSTGIGAGKIDTNELKNLSLGIPGKPEQQKIANCLSSLDTLIAAQTDKIAALQQHKQGLLQQLFPAMDTAAI